MKDSSASGNKRDELNLNLRLVHRTWGVRCLPSRRINSVWTRLRSQGSTLSFDPGSRRLWYITIPLCRSRRTGLSDENGRRPLHKYGQIRKQWRGRRVMSVYCITEAFIILRCVPRGAQFTRFCVCSTILRDRHVDISRSSSSSSQEQRAWGMWKETNLLCW